MVIEKERPVPVDKTSQNIDFSVSHLTTDLIEALAQKQDIEIENKKDEAIAFVKEEGMPIIDEALERLEAADTPNKKVKKMNDMQTEAKQYAKETFNNLIAYFKGNDVYEQDIEQGNEELKEKYLDVFDYREELIDQYNLVEENDSDFPKLKRAEQ